MKGKINDLNKMKGNKIKAILLIAVFILSTLAITIPIVSAITIDPALTSGNVGDVVTVSGVSDTPGSLIECYWDEVHPWDTDTVTGLLNFTYASGVEYSLEITVPETIQGDYDVIVKDVEASSFVSGAFTVDSKITLTPETGLSTDSITVNGTGFDTKSDITMTFSKTVPAISGEEVGTGDGTETVFQLDYFPVVATSETIYAPGIGDATYTSGDGVTSSTTTITVTAPTTTADFTAGLYDDATGLTELVAPAASTGDDSTADTVVITYAYEDSTAYRVKITLADETGSYTLSDDGDGAGSGGPIVIADDAAYTLIDETGVITFTTAPASGVLITADYTMDDIDITPATTPETSVLGYFDASFDVPDLPYGVEAYTIIAEDEVPNSASALLTIGATITLIPDEGPSGIVVDITGIGFTEIAGEIVTITMEGPVQVVATIETTASGTFSGTFIVPTVVELREYTVTAEDEKTVSGSLDFEVTGTTAITLEPTAGAPDDLITIEGTNFTAIVGTVVTINFGGLADYATFETNSTGGFKSTISVPQLPPDPETPYDVTATDTYDLTASAEFTVVLTTLAVSPSKGPTGTKVLVIGGGYTPDTDFNVTIDGTLMIGGEETTGGDGSLPSSFYVYVPTLTIGEYTLTVMDEEGVTGTTSFEVTKTTELLLTPDSGPVTYPISLEANYFTAEDLTDITITLYNETAGERDYEKVFLTTDITAATDFTSIKTNATGSYEGIFLVLELALGDYIINATDSNSLTVETTFSVVEVYMDIHTVSTEYDPSDTVSFYINATFPFDLEIDIEDPTGFPVTTIGPIDDLEWGVMGDYYVVPLADASFDLPSDAMTGLWNWTAYDVTDAEAPVEVDNGNFTVGEPVGPEPEYPADTTGQETLDSTGAPQDSFTSGETVNAYSLITNVGNEYQTILIVVQFKDPNNVVYAPAYITAYLDPEEDMGYAPGLTILPGYATGTWTAKINLLTTWPSLNGVPIGLPVTIEFEVS